MNDQHRHQRYGGIGRFIARRYIDHLPDGLRSGRQEAPVRGEMPEWERNKVQRGTI